MKISNFTVDVRGYPMNEYEIFWCPLIPLSSLCNKRLSTVWPKELFRRNNAMGWVSASIWDDFGEGWHFEVVLWKYTVGNFRVLG